MKKILKQSNQDGITLVALVVTIVVLLILAGITLVYVVGDNSVFKQASEAKLEYQIAQAREKIEITFGHAQILKHTEPKYNQDDYLDNLMKNEISNIKIEDDIVIVDGFAFEIDRSVPKIGQYLGKEEDLIFPEITATVTLATDKKTATIHITSKEETNGISKIEVIQDGHVIETYTYDNKKEPITEEYEVKQNGTYTIKAYAKLTGKTIVEVDGIIMSMEYTPNGNTIYKKEQQVKVTVNETDDKVKSIKYQWLNTTIEPETNTFIESCNNGATLTKNGITGRYYLWTLLETEKGKTRVERSEAFYFDNQGPTVTLTSTPVSATSFTLNATATDNNSGIKQYDFYVNGIKKGTQTTSAGSASYKATGVSTGNTSCYVIIVDKAGNTTKQTVTGKTKLYTWERFSVEETKRVQVVDYGYVSVSKRSIDRVYWHTDKSNGCSVDNADWTGATFYTNALGLKEHVDEGRDLLMLPEYHTNNRFGLWLSSGVNKDSNIIFSGRKLIPELERTFSKGTTQYSNVTSVNSTTYPNNKEQKDGNTYYWYVYKGIQ